MPEAELVERYDAFMLSPANPHGMEPSDYADELARRQAERQRATLDKLNTRLYWLTLVAAGAAVVQVVVAIIA